MSDLNKRMGVIAELVKVKPGLGKTAMMKCIFILQEVYKVPLGYDFEIYTYGPYASEIMEDIDYADFLEIINIKRTFYSSGYCGYELTPSKNTDKIVDQEEKFISDHYECIKEVIELFGDKTAKELELLTTIIYLYNTYKANNWDCNLESISKNVHEIKPHFELSMIKNEYRNLEKLGLLA